MRRLVNKLSSLTACIYNPSGGGIAAIAILIALISMTFSSLVFLQHSKIILSIPYKGFNYIGNEFLLLIMFINSFILLRSLTKNTIDAEVTLSLSLKVMSLLWAIIAALFIDKFPPLSTGVTTYGLLSLFSLITAFELDNRLNQKLLFIKETINE